MDMEKPLKFEGECFGLDTDSDFYDPLALMGFGMQQWNQEYPADQIETDTMRQVVDKIQVSLNIAHTPLEQLVTMVKQESGQDYLKEDQVRRILRKTKLIEKRKRAKNRKELSSKTMCFQQITLPTPIQQNLGDLKKKKNRLSAQISRDKKKQYYTMLQEQNKRLKKDLIALKAQKIELASKSSFEEKKSTSSYNCSFVSLLLFLGIIFFLDLCKSTRNTNKKSIDRAALTKISLNAVQRNKIQNQMDKFGLKLKVVDLEDSLYGFEDSWVSRKTAESLKWVIETNI